MNFRIASEHGLASVAAGAEPIRAQKIAAREICQPAHLRCLPRPSGRSLLPVDAANGDNSGCDRASRQRARFDRSTATSDCARPSVCPFVVSSDAMPHASDSRRIEDPFGATDEVKVYKDEGEDEKPENLSEEKFGLVTETEEVLKAGSIAVC